METYTLYLLSKFGLLWSIHLWQHLLSLSFMQCNICSPGSYAPFTFLCQLQLSKHHCGDFYWSGVRWSEKGWNSPPCRIPSKHSHDKALCVRPIQLNRTPCMLRSYQDEAKYTLSYQRHRMSDCNSQFFGKSKHIYYASPLQAVQIKTGRQRGNINTVLCDCWETWKMGLYSSCG